MKRDRPSVTAAWVAACRGMSARLPEGQRLVHDPYGVRFLPGARLATPIFPRRAILYMQVRTRFIDDVVRSFVGRQVVILGAGFDCRALRLDVDARYFEVDHPATQKKKRALVGDSKRAEYLAWNFEERPMSELASALAACGHDATSPTLTIWEGVTMYLSERAIDDTLRAIRGYSAPGSKLVFNYMDRARIENPGLRVWLGARVVSAIGETFRFGWDPTVLGEDLARHGLSLERQRTIRELAQELIGQDVLPRANDLRIAVASV